MEARSKPSEAVEKKGTLRRSPWKERRFSEKPTSDKVKWTHRVYHELREKSDAEVG